MKILIVGNNLNSILLAQYIKLHNNVHDIFVTDEDTSKNEYYTAVNISENDIQSLSDFVKYNQIEFTIVTSSISIINGIADVFKKEGFIIFAPPAEASRITFFNSIAKKIMYKLKINTPKFGIFDRENLATEYIRNSKFPIVIENDFTLLYRECNVYDRFSKAKLGLQKIFDNNNEKIVIENYIDSEPLYIYFITDGFNALPLITLQRSSGCKYTTVLAPSEKISDNIIINILRSAIYPLLDDIIKYAGNYSGILGLKIKIYNNHFYILEFYNSFQYYDFQAFLSLIDDDLLSLLYDAAKGGLCDNHKYVNLNGKYSYTIAVDKSCIDENRTENDYIESEDTQKIIFTNTALTKNYAKKDLLEYIETECNSEIYEEIKRNDEKCTMRI